MEKVALISLECIIFAQLLPGLQARSIQIATAVAFVIAVNTALSLWLAGRGASWRSTIQEFLVMSAVNLLLFLLFYIFLQHRVDGLIELEATLFFVLLLTLNVTLYDRYWKIYMLRIDKGNKQG
jgi:heme/copper-type cytochrome/quinol oxidase subunit 4